MLKPIHRLACSPALAACQNLMQQFARWLCDPAITAAHLTLDGLQPPAMPSGVEAGWLWEFLQLKKDKQPLLDRATVLASMPAGQKALLAGWIQTVSTVPAQFQPAPSAWPTSQPSIAPAYWGAFKTVMEAFYDKGFRAGLPYLEDGTPVPNGGVTYADFVSTFRSTHRLNPDPNAREVCVLCGGLLGDTPHVDHWITKSAYPLLSVCQDNLTLICSTCNEAPNKGEKPVYSGGSFSDWFHPYLRPGNGALQLDYSVRELSIRCSTPLASDQPRADNLDGLLNLTSRWTREFKAEYAKHQDALRRRERIRLEAGLVRQTAHDINTYIQQWIADLLPSEPHHEVYTVLGKALGQVARSEAWLAELATVAQDPQGA